MGKQCSTTNHVTLNKILPQTSQSRLIAVKNHVKVVLEVKFSSLQKDYKREKGLKLSRMSQTGEIYQNAG